MRDSRGLPKADGGCAKTRDEDRYEEEITLVLHRIPISNKIARQRWRCALVHVYGVARASQCRPSKRSLSMHRYCIDYRVGATVREVGLRSRRTQRALERSVPVRRDLTTARGSGVDWPSRDSRFDIIGMPSVETEIKSGQVQTRVSR